PHQRYLYRFPNTGRDPCFCNFRINITSMSEEGQRNRDKAHSSNSQSAPVHPLILTMGIIVLLRAQVPKTVVGPSHRPWIREFGNGYWKGSSTFVFMTRAFVRRA